MERGVRIGRVAGVLAAVFGGPERESLDDMIERYRITRDATIVTATAIGTTKGAIEALSRTLAIELAPAGIRVNTVAPGFVVTPMLTPQLEAMPDLERILVDQTPSGRLGRPEEVAATVTFLLSGLAEYINGSVITIDGGWTAR